MRVTIDVPDFLYNFYQRVGIRTGLTPQQVMADSLFKLAGQLSQESLHKNEAGQH